MYIYLYIKYFSSETTSKQFKETNRSHISCNKNINNICNIHNNNNNNNHTNIISTSQTAPPSCISFVNQLVNQTSLLLNENKSSKSSSILKEITKTASCNDIDGYDDEEEEDYIENKNTTTTPTSTANTNTNNPDITKLAAKSRGNRPKQKKSHFVFIVYFYCIFADFTQGQFCSAGR
jgi:hypothetical protein